MREGRSSVGTAPFAGEQVEPYGLLAPGFLPWSMPGILEWSGSAFLFAAGFAAGFLPGVVFRVLTALFFAGWAFAGPAVDDLLSISVIIER